MKFYVSKIQALGGVFASILCASIAVAAYSDGEVGKVFAFVASFAAGASAHMLARATREAIHDRGSVWWQPVSSKSSSIFVNAIAVIWLLVVAILVSVMLGLKVNSPFFVLVVAFLVVFGAIFGRFLSKRFSAKNLLPYAVSFFLVLVGVLAAFVIATSR